MTNLDSILDYIKGMEVTPEQKDRLIDTAFITHSLERHGYERIHVEGGEVFAVAPPHSDLLREMRRKNDALEALVEGIDDIRFELQLLRQEVKK